jgi:omega-amidase
MSDLKVALVQTQQYWEDKNANFVHFDALLEAEIHEAIDVLIFPEMFHTGFTMNAKELAESMDNSPGLDWLSSKSKKYNCLCVASLIINENGQYFNRMVAVHPDGKIDYYDKINLFSLAKEDEYYTAGKTKTIVQFRGWKLLLQVCYDLRFPENARNSVQNEENFEYDAIIYVANWPERRIAHWEKLIPARSIENQCFTIAVNRVGEDNNALFYNGSSQIVDPMGEYILSPEYHDVKAQVRTLSRALLVDTRKKLAFLKDRRIAR